jgi:hypothetical protein
MWHRAIVRWLKPSKIWWTSVDGQLIYWYGRQNTKLSSDLEEEKGRISKAGFRCLVAVCSNIFFINYLSYYILFSQVRWITAKHLQFNILNKMLNCHWYFIICKLFFTIKSTTEPHYFIWICIFSLHRIN